MREVVSGYKQEKPSDSSRHPPAAVNCKPKVAIAAALLEALKAKQELPDTHLLILCAVTSPMKDASRE